MDKIGEPYKRHFYVREGLGMVAATRRTVGPCTQWPQDSTFIRELLERVGDKWTMLVVATLGGGPLRYTDLFASVPGISQRMLTATLKNLERDGLATRTAYPEVPPRVEYALTPLGSSLLEAVTALATWAVAHHAEVAANRARHEPAAGKP